MRVDKSGKSKTEIDKLINKPIGKFLDELASSSPAPGGGSVAALCGALSTALSSMVSNLTKPKMKESLAKSEDLREKLAGLIDEDTNAFNEVMEAFKMPKETTEQKEERKKKIQEAYKNAALVPLSTARYCLKALDMCRVVAEKGNVNSVSDAGVAALMATAGMKAAILNVKINLPYIKDGKFVKEIEEEIKDFEIDEREVMKTVERRMKE